MTQYIQQPGDSQQTPDALNNDLDESLGFLVVETARLAKRALYVRLARHGIRGGSWYVLRVLWRGDGMTQRELATKLGMTQPSTLQMLRAMESDDLVRFARDEVDRRKLRVYLTERAQALKAPSLREAAEANPSIRQRLPQVEATLLKMLLRTMRDALADDLLTLGSAESVGEAGELDLRQESNVAEGQAAELPPTSERKTPARAGGKRTSAV